MDIKYIFISFKELDSKSNLVTVKTKQTKPFTTILGHKLISSFLNVSKQSKTNKQASKQTEKPQRYKVQATF